MRASGPNHKIFVSRLVTTPAPAHFELANNGAPISIDANDATRPDITFDGHTPYVTWREDIGGGVTKGFSGHFTSRGSLRDRRDQRAADADRSGRRPRADLESAARPTRSTATVRRVRAAPSARHSSCSPTERRRNLFADAYQPNTPATGGASGITRSSATVSGSVATNGAAVNVSFQFGTTAAYGHTTPAQKTAPDGSPAAFSAASERAAGEYDDSLPSGRHERLRYVHRAGPYVPHATRPPSPSGPASIGRASVSGTTASVGAICSGNSADSRAGCGPI